MASRTPRWCKTCERWVPVSWPTEPGPWHLGAVCSDCEEMFFVKMAPDAGPWARTSCHDRPA
jgi:hypothetical protein